MLAAIADRLPVVVASPPSSRVIFGPGVRMNNLKAWALKVQGWLAWDCPGFKNESPATQVCPQDGSPPPTWVSSVGAAGGQSRAAASLFTRVHLGQGGFSLMLLGFRSGSLSQKLRLDSFMSCS